MRAHNERWGVEDVDGGGGRQEKEKYEKGALEQVALRGQK